MLNEDDFETVAHTIKHDDQYKPEERAAMNSALLSAYGDLDRVLIDWMYRSENPLAFNLYGFQELLTRFFGEERRDGKIGFIFTLNQDLCLERKYFSFSAPGIVGRRPKVLGLSHGRQWFSSHFDSPVSSDDYCKLPTEEDLNEKICKDLKNQPFIYVKLHGSQNWLSSDGSEQLVIGRDKLAQIKDEPILTASFEIFRRALFQPERRLLIIGYGFGDDHINNEIASAVRRSHLKVFILSPSGPDKLKETLYRKEKWKGIWKKGLSGYFPFSFKQLFAKESGPTQAMTSLVTQFFQKKI